MFNVDTVAALLQSSCTVWLMLSDMEGVVSLGDKCGNIALLLFDALCQPKRSVPIRSSAFLLCVDGGFTPQFYSDTAFSITARYAFLVHK